MTSAIYRNTARLAYSLTLIDGRTDSGELSFASHAELLPDTYYLGRPEPAEFLRTRPGLAPYQHERDAEKQAVNALASRVYRWLGCRSEADYLRKIKDVRKGSVTITSDLGPCHSCREVIKDFRAHFPALTITINYRNHLGGGRTAKKMAAGDGLSGYYGYEDAVEQQDKNWKMVYAGRPIPAATVTYALGVDGRDPIAGTAEAVSGQPYTAFVYQDAAGSGPNAETVLLDTIAGKVRERLIALNADDGFSPIRITAGNFAAHAQAVTGGTVTLRSERGPSASSRSAIDRFRQHFPTVALTVEYDGANPDEGGYGYPDARAAGIAHWSKAFPAAVRRV